MDADRLEARLRVSAPPPPDGLREAIRGRLNRRPRRRLEALLPLAASILVCAALLFGTRPGRPDASPGRGQDADRVARLIARLGDADLQAREAAFLELRELGPGVREALKRAEREGDPEVRGRARELLEDVALLPVDKDLHAPLRDVAALESKRVADGLKSLLRADRDRVVRALEMVAREGGARARARADGLRRLLAREPRASIRYGLIPIEASYERDARVDAFEIWINESPEPFFRADWRGSDIDYYADGDEAGELVGEMMNMFGRVDLQEVALRPGGVAVHVWKDLLPFPRRPGRYVVRHHGSVLIQASGTQAQRPVQTNPVTFRIR